MKPAVAKAKEIMICNLQPSDIVDGCLVQYNGELCEVAISMFDDTTMLPSVIGLKNLLNDEIITLDLNSNFYDLMQVLHNGDRFEFKRDLLAIKIELPVKIQLPTNWQDVVLDSTIGKIESGMDLYYGYIHKIEQQAVLIKGSVLRWLNLSKTTDTDEGTVAYEIQSYDTEISDTGVARFSPIDASTSGDIEVNDEDGTHKTKTAGQKQFKKTVEDLVKDGWTQVL